MTHKDSLQHFDQVQNGFWVRLPNSFGARVIAGNWKDGDAVFPFPGNPTDDTFSKCQDESEYKTLVAQAIEEIQSGRCQKLVTSRIFEVQADDVGMFELFEKWLTIFEDAFVFVLHHQDHGLWIGASPELLIYRKGSILRSLALAGSKSIDDNSNWTPKEHKEHQVVVDMIADTLVQSGGSELQLGETTEMKYRKVKHLSTEIKVNFSGDFDEVVRALYPTPALSGWPKNSASRWLVDHEPFDRGLYGGAFTFSSAEEKWAVVILRCCHKTRNEKWLGHVGGGVMGNSEPELEWQETEWKRQAFIFADNADHK